MPGLELPPLARGRVQPPREHTRSSGITPARAGKSIARKIMKPFSRNYPRSRGEEPLRGAGILNFTELPPLARGRAAHSAPAPTALGITPARAGKSDGRAPMRAGRWNYPRSRGEEISNAGAISRAVELPPLARGRGRDPFPFPGSKGITPARAGKRGFQGFFIFLEGNYPRSRGEE